MMLKQLPLLFLALILPVELLCAAPPDEKKDKAAAKQYFLEYQAMRRNRGNSQETMAKLRNALRLDPRNEEYRFAELSASASAGRYARTLGNRLDFFTRQIELAKKYRKDFPKSERYIFSNPEIFPPFLWISPDSEISREEQKRFSEFRMEFARLATSEKLSDAPLFPEGKNAPDGNDFQKALTECVRGQSPFFWKDLDEYLAAREKYARLFLAGFETSFRKTDGRSSYFRQKIRSCGVFALGHTLLWTDRDKNTDKIFLAYLKKSDDFLAILKNSDLPEARESALTMETIRTLAASGSSRERLRKIMLGYFEALDTIDPGWVAGKDFPETGEPLDKFLLSGFSFLPDKLGTPKSKFLTGILSDYRETRKIETDADARAIPGKAEMIALLRNGDIPGIKKNMEMFRSQGLGCVLDPELGEALRQFRGEPAEKLFSEFNRAYKIRREPYGDFFKLKMRARCFGAFESSGTVYVFLRLPKNQYALGILEPGKPPKYSDLPDLVPVTDEVMFGDAFHIGASGKILAVSDAKSIFVSDNGGRKWRFLISIKGELPVRGLHIAGKRLYVLSSLDGGEKTPKAVSLFSIMPDGSGKEVHFDSRKKNKTLEIEKISDPFIPCMAAKDDLIVFRLGTSLWSFNAKSGEIEKRLELGPCNEFTDLSFRDGSFWTTNGRYGGQLLKINAADWTKEIFFVQEKSGKTESQYRLNSDVRLRPPFVVKDSILYSGSYNPFGLRLKDPEKSPLLFLPSAIAVHETGTEVAFFNRDEIFLVKPKEK